MQSVTFLEAVQTKEGIVSRPVCNTKMDCSGVTEAKEDICRESAVVC